MNTPLITCRARVLALAALLCVAAAGAASPSAAAAQAVGEPLMLRLRDGSIRFGSVRGHDPRGVEFVRIENGGVAHVPWSMLDPGQEAELRRAFGYVDDTAEEILVDADRLLLDDGREIVGKILSRSDDAILLKTSTATIPVPKSRVIAAATTVRVPAFEIYTREELYVQALSLASPDDAASQFALAQYCERILDFAHALEHYEKTRSLDAGFRGDDLRWALERARDKAARQDQIDYLADVDLSLARKQFDEALQRAEAFSELYPGSPLLPDAARKVERVLKARKRALGELVVKRWHGAAAKLARDAATREFDEVLGWLDEGMQEEVFQAVLEDARQVQADVEDDTLRQLWVERDSGRWRLASYGYGTWLLGEDKALEGMQEDEEESAPAVTAKDKEREELEQRIKRFLENQELRRSAKSSQDKSDDRATEWKLLSSAARSQWILAYYAENSGDMEVKPRVAFRACRECGGRGVREIIVTGDARTRQGENQSGSGIHKVECPTCRGLGVVRRIYYR